MQGVVVDRDWTNPFAHLLQISPVTPGLHKHCPEVWLHDDPIDPTGWQLHSERLSFKHIIFSYENPCSFSIMHPHAIDLMSLGCIG